MKDKYAVVQRFSIEQTNPFFTANCRKRITQLVKIIGSIEDGCEAPDLNRDCYLTANMGMCFLMSLCLFAFVIFLVYYLVNGLAMALNMHFLIFRKVHNPDGYVAVSCGGGSNANPLAVHCLLHHGQSGEKFDPLRVANESFQDELLKISTLLYQMQDEYSEVLEFADIDDDEQRVVGGTGNVSRRYTVVDSEDDSGYHDDFGNDDNGNDNDDEDDEDDDDDDDDDDADEEEEEESRESKAKLMLQMRKEVNKRLPSTPLVVRSNNSPALTATKKIPATSGATTSGDPPSPPDWECDHDNCTVCYYDFCNDCRGSYCEEHTDGGHSCSAHLAATAAQKDEEDNAAKSLRPSTSLEVPSSNFLAKNKVPATSSATTGGDPLSQFDWDCDHDNCTTRFEGVCDDCRGSYCEEHADGGHSCSAHLTAIAAKKDEEDTAAKNNRENATAKQDKEDATAKQDKEDTAAKQEDVDTAAKKKKSDAATMEKFKIIEDGDLVQKRSVGGNDRDFIVLTRDPHARKGTPVRCTDTIVGEVCSISRRVVIVILYYVVCNIYIVIMCNIICGCYSNIFVVIVSNLAHI
jgi:hypothetical protein